MPYDGSGSYSAPASSWNPAVDGTDIDSSDWAALLADIDTALSTCMLKDGQQTATAVIPFALGITLAGGSTLAKYVTGSFTCTGTGFSVDPTGTAYYTVIGNVVTVDYPALTGTSDATTFTITGQPAAIQPTTAKDGTTRTQDNGAAYVAASYAIGTNGVVTLAANADGGAFTASGTKATGKFTVVYTLN